MPDLCIVIRRAPYGALAAAEGVRHLLGAAQAGMLVSAALVDDGVYLSRRGQDLPDAAWTNLSGALAQALGPRATGSSAPAHVYVHRQSAEARGLDHLDLVPGVEWIDDRQLAAVLAEARTLLIF